MCRARMMMMPFCDEQLFMGWKFSAVKRSVFYSCSYICSVLMLVVVVGITGVRVCM